MKTITTYIAFDGTIFDDYQKAKAYEEESKNKVVDRFIALPKVDVLWKYSGIPGSMEENGFYRMDIQTEEELKIAKDYLALMGEHKAADKVQLGHKYVFEIGDGDFKSNSYIILYDAEELFENIRKNILG